MNSILKKGAEMDWENPFSDQVKSFRDLRGALGVPPVLELPKRDQPFMLDMDASKYAMGHFVAAEGSEEGGVV